jgi:hypothetical protein
LALITGINNTAVGRAAGGVITTGSACIFLGNDTVASATGATNQIVIGDNIAATANDQVSIGKSGAIASCDFGTDAVWTQASDARRKNVVGKSDLGLAFINELQPVLYTQKPAKEWPKEWGIPEDTEIDTETLLTGLLAQEVKAALDKVGAPRFSGWSEDAQGQRIGKEAFVFPLINAVKELSAQVVALQKAVADLKAK